MLILKAVGKSNIHQISFSCKIQKEKKVICNICLFRMHVKPEKSWYILCHISLGCTLAH